MNTVVYAGIYTSLRKIKAPKAIRRAVTPPKSVIKSLTKGPLALTPIGVVANTLSNPPRKLSDLYTPSSGSKKQLQKAGPIMKKFGPVLLTAAPFLPPPVNAAAAAAGGSMIAASKLLDTLGPVLPKSAKKNTAINLPHDTKDQVNKNINDEILKSKNDPKKVAELYQTKQYLN